MYENKLIYGKSDLQGIVSIEPSGGEDMSVFVQNEDGEVEQIVGPATYWFLTNKKISDKQETLDGNQYFKYLATFNTLEEQRTLRKTLMQKRMDYYDIYDTKESNLVFNGMTYYKGLQLKDISVLSFDIESDGLVQTKDSEIYLITNTFRNKKKTVRKTFSLEDYPSQKEMLQAWVDWVYKMNPSIMLGHNIFGYDLPYIQHVADLHDVKLNLGRDGSELRFNTYSSEYRKDGSQSYTYFNAHIYGREIIDTMFLSIKYDVVKKEFPSYGLKPIVKALGMEKPGRSFVDASKIKEYYNNRHADPEMWAKVKQYAEEDSDDALKLFDKMAPSYFYFTQSVSKTFQQMINGATGSQINNMMVRAYLQDGHSVAKADEAAEFAGGISIGIPGIYKNCLKWDLASAYPHTIIQFELYDKRKDPKAYFLYMVRYFTSERIKNKKLAKSTGEQYYSDMEQAQKIVINSFFGFCGAKGLAYNAPAVAAEITRRCRGYITDSIRWATGKELDHWQALAKPEEADINE
jgi:DNA polymerase, archaea type